MNGARKSTTGVDRPRELEGLSAPYRKSPVCRDCGCLSLSTYSFGGVYVAASGVVTYLGNMTSLRARLVARTRLTHG